VVPSQKSVHIRVLESLSSERYAQPEEGTEIGETVLDLPPDLHREPLRSAITACGGDLFRYGELPCDHDFTSHRIALSEMIARFLVELVEG